MGGHGRYTGIAGDRRVGSKGALPARWSRGWGLRGKLRLRFGSGLLVAALAVVVTVAGSSASAQMPDSFTNLQHFPADISRDELIDAMRTIALDLGVRCQFCHVGSPDGVSFDGVDFASDESPNKRAARYMLGMVDRLNADIGQNLEDTPRDRNEISCKTCHRGLARPTLLYQELDRTLELEGVAGLEEAYDRARRSLEAGRYDFREWEIILFAERLEGEGRLEEALGVHAVNLRQHPESSAILGNMARIQEALDRMPEAIETLERMLVLTPEDESVQAALARLRGGVSP